MINIIARYANRKTGDSDAIFNLSRVYESGPAEALIAAANACSDDCLAEIMDNPQIDPPTAKDDVRYILGFMAGLKWVIDLPQDARRYIQTLE